MKNILFISYDGMTDPLGQSQVIPYLAGLTKYGYEFTILSCEKPGKFNANKNYVEDILKNYSIKWVPIPYHKKPPVLSSVYDFFMLKKKAKQLHRYKKFDLVHTRSGIPTLVALWLKKKYGIKFLNDIRGFWADERIDGGMWNMNNPVFKLIYKWFKKKEYECLEISDYNVCLTYRAKDEILSWKNVSRKPLGIEVIPCSVDIELFNPENIKEELKKELGNELKINADDFIISYLGSTDGWYLTNEMLQFCKKLIDKISNTKILFISPQNHSEIKSYANKFGIPDEKLIIRNGKRHEVPALLSFSNYSVFFIKPCYSKMSSSPTKHGEIMAMGIPVITNSGVGDVKQIVEKYKSGFVINDFSDSNYDEILKNILSQNEFDKSAIRNGAKEFYDLGNAIKHYKKIYDTILYPAT